MSPSLTALLALSLAAPPADELFKSTGPVPVLRITLDDPNLKLLRQNDRLPVRARLHVSGGETLENVGLHLKGAIGSKRGWDDKPGLTLNADKFVDGQTFRGLDKFHLNNGVQDGSYLSELLANELAAAVGLPHCRCTHALVELNGRKAGLYVLKEGFDGVWLKRNFADATGNLYDGGFQRDLDQDLKLDHGQDVGRKDLKEIVKACREGDANKRFAAVEKLVDVDRFITYSAFEVLTADWDGYPRCRNNYRLYFDPKAGGKAVFIPHGMDQMWQNPHDGLEPGVDGMVARAILGHPEGKKRLNARLKELVKDQFDPEKFQKRIDELTPRIKEALATVDKGAAQRYDGEAKSLKDRIKQRAEFLRRETPKLK
jgi:spore coat protein CotH